MKPIWIVDDDQSIRFVLEKALSRESLATRSFTNPREVTRWRTRPNRRRCWSATSACPAAAGSTCWAR